MKSTYAVIRCLECGQPRIVSQDHETAGCAFCPNTIDVAAKRTIAESDDREDLVGILKRVREDDA